MCAQAGSAQCFKFSEYGHYRSQRQQNNDRKKRRHNEGKPHWNKNGGDGGSNDGTGGRDGSGGNNGGRRGRGGNTAGRGRGGGGKRCFLYNTTSHNDLLVCLKQKTSYNTGSAKLANIYSPHYSKSPVNTTAETISEVTMGYMGGYSFMASTAAEPAL